MLTPAPAVLGGCSLLTAVELICLVHLILCIVVIGTASSVSSVDYAGVRVSGFMQCLNGAWFLLGIPFIIVGGVGSVFRVAHQIEAYLAYLVGTFCVTVAWLGIFIRYGNACNTIQPTSGQYKKQALMICQASNGMAIFWMLVLLGVVAGAVYLVWSMLQYVNTRVATELLRYQEPWESASALADDTAMELVKQRQFLAHHQKRSGAWAPNAYLNDPLKISKLSNEVPAWTAQPVRMQGAENWGY